MAAVLRTICANQHGLFWAGDTAQVWASFIRVDHRVTLPQTISIGSSFRFADLKAYQHRIEVGISVILHHTGVDDLPRNNFHTKRALPLSNQEPLSLS